MAAPRKLCSLILGLLLLALEGKAGIDIDPVYPREERVQLEDAFGQAGRSWLQDVGRFHFVNVLVANRGNPRPAGPQTDEILIDLAAAPRGQDGIRCSRDNRFRRDYTVLRCFLDRQVGKHVLSACDLDQLG